MRPDDLLPLPTPEQVLALPGDRSGQSCGGGRSCGAAVRPLPQPDGSLAFDPDFTLPSTAGPITWALLYNSLDAGHTGLWGNSYRSSLDLSLESKNLGSSNVVVVQHEDGSFATYRLTGFSYSPDPGTVGALVQNGNGSWDETRGDSGYVYHFPAGNLVSLAYRQSPQGLYLTFTYDGNQRLTTVEEPAGRRLTLGYATGTTTTVQYVQDWGDRRNTLSYDVLGNLVEVQGPTGCLTQYEYDASHRLTEITDPEGYTTSYTWDFAGRIASRSVAGDLTQHTYAYDANGSLLHVTIDPLNRIRTSTVDIYNEIIADEDPLGNRWLYSYADFRMLSEQNPLGAVWTYTYDSAGNLLTATDPLGHIRSRSYDAYNNLLTDQDPLGATTTYTYGLNPQNRLLISEMNPLGFVRTYSYTTWGVKEGEIDPLGNRATWIWNNAGELDATINPLGNIRSYVHNAVGNRVAVIDELGNRWSYSYNTLSQRTSRQNPIGNIWTTVFDARGLVLADLDPQGNCTSYQYNAYGSLTGIINALGARVTNIYDTANQQTAGVDAFGNRTTCTYDAAGRPVCITDPIGANWTAYYDQAGHLIGGMTPLGSLVTVSCNALGQQVAFADALGRVTTVMYDANRRAIAFSDGAGYLTTLTYDQAGRAKTTILARGTRLTYYWDAAGRSVSRENALGFRISNIYDRTGSLIASVNELGARNSIIYGATGREVARIDPLGRISTSSYDRAGRKVLSLDAKGQMTTVLYDACNRRTGELFIDGSCLTFLYDQINQLMTIYDASGCTTQTFDQRGLLQSVNGPYHPGGVPITYGFDAVRRRISMQFGLDRHSFAFDNAGHNTRYIDPAGGTTTWTYDPADQVIQQVNPNGTATTWSYETRGLISGIRHRTESGIELGVDVYTYDWLRNPTRKATLSGVTTWVYGITNELIAEHHPTGLITTWTYDAAHNRVTQDQMQHGVRSMISYEYDIADQRLLATEGTSITTTIYDANGNLWLEQTGSGTATYLWDPRNLLVNYASPAGTVATFTHRFDKLRASVAPGEDSAVTRFVWDRPGPTGLGDLLAEVDEMGNITRQYWRGMRLVTLRSSDQSYVYGFDHQGNTERLTDQNAGVVADYQYSAWGELLQTFGGIQGQPFLYGGEWGAYRDAVSGQMWMRARMMDPTKGQFLSVDPVGAEARLPWAQLEGWDRNPYWYVTNRPVIFTDPSGESGGFAITIGGVTVTVTVGLLLLAVSLGIITVGVLACVMVPACRQSWIDALQDLWDWIRDQTKTRCPPPLNLRNDNCTETQWNMCVNYCITNYGSDFYPYDCKPSPIHPQCFCKKRGGYTF